MEYFRKYLIYIRRLDNTDMKPRFIILMLITTFISIIFGVIADKFLPFNFGYNIIRGILAFTTGASSASYSLIVSNRIKKSKSVANSEYLPLKKKLSYRQRANISILIGSIITTFILLSTEGNLVFTLKTSIAIFAGIILVAFARKDRTEFLKDVYNIPDVRDLEFMSKKIKNAELKTRLDKDVKPSKKMSKIKQRKKNKMV